MLHFSKNVLPYALMSFLIFLSYLFQIHAESISKGIVSYPHFCQLAADNEEVFNDFKRNPIYQKILEHVPYDLGLLYLNIIVNEYPELLIHFDRFRQNDLLGNPLTFDYENVGYFSPTTLRYIKIAGDLKKKFGDLSKMHIVEIGGGYGGQCKILAELGGFASYTIIDLPECNALSKKYLDRLGVQNVSFINNDRLSEALTYDLVISNFAFSEIDLTEQKKYIKYVITSTPNGYMTMNFISHHFNLQSLSVEELVGMLLQGGRKGKVEAEQPSTHPDNLLLTWYTNKVFAKSLKKQPLLKPSSNLQTANAVTYTFSGGRLGDNLLSYFHARWLSYKYGLPLLYKPFLYSDQFSLHNMDQREGKDFSFKNVISLSKESDIQAAPSSSLFISPYFPETRSEYEWCNLSWLPFFNVDWEDPGFREEVVKCLQPKHSVKTLTLPSNCITVALHIRRGDEANFPAYRTWPLKFVPDDYYIQQIQRMAKIFSNEKLYIHLFTNDNNPQLIVKKYKKILNNPKITFSYQEVKDENKLLEDFFSIPKFDCCILCQSNFSVIASKLGNYLVLIIPVHTVMKDNKPMIDEIDLIFKAGQEEL
jgi:hypothetical protein